MIVLGLMSGSSMDGVDLALCEFKLDADVYSYKVLEAETLHYPDNLYDQLKNAFRFSALDLRRLDKDLGIFFAKSIEQFLQKYPKVRPELIANSGHTIFHQPEDGFTVQIGNSSQIVALNQISTLADFRSLDVSLGGNGAPLVPVGDRLLYPKYEACLNLGGISNISYEVADGRKAFDVSPFNLALNYFAEKVGKPFDKGGEIAKSGRINTDLLNSLNELPFYQKEGPKSLGREWIVDKFIPLFSSYWDTPPNYLRTLVEHLAIQLAASLPFEQGRCLVTGGGAWNEFFIERFRAHAKGWEIVRPEAEVVDFKEAIIFAFLAFLYKKNIINVLASVTGSKRSHIAGALYKA